MTVGTRYVRDGLRKRVGDLVVALVDMRCAARKQETHIVGGDSINAEIECETGKGEGCDWGGGVKAA